MHASGKNQSTKTGTEFHHQQPSPKRKSAPISPPRSRSSRLLLYTWKHRSKGDHGKPRTAYAKRLKTSGFDCCCLHCRSDFCPPHLRRDLSSQQTAFVFRSRVRPFKHNGVHGASGPSTCRMGLFHLRTLPRRHYPQPAYCHRRPFSVLVARRYREIPHEKRPGHLYMLVPLLRSHAICSRAGLYLRPPRRRFRYHQGRKNRTLHRFCRKCPACSVRAYEQPPPCGIFVQFQRSRLERQLPLRVVLLARCWLVRPTLRSILCLVAPCRKKAATPPLLPL